MIKINISSILEEGGEKKIEERVNKLGQGISLTGSLLIKGKIYKTDNGVLADIKVSGKEKINCDRCLEEFGKKIEKNISQEFVMPQKNLKGDELEEKQAGFTIDEKNEIDLEASIIEEILLDNERNICKTSCKGLCPKCGKNLNKEKCKCESQKAEENPFRELEQLKK